MSQTKYVLGEDAIPTHWVNLLPDLPGEPHHPQRIYNYFCVHLKMAPQPAFILDITNEWEQKLAAIRQKRLVVDHEFANL